MIDKEIEMQLNYAQKEPVRVWQIGKHVVVMVESKNKKRVYQQYLNQQQFELLLEKLLKVQKIRNSRGYPKKYGKVTQQGKKD